MNNLLQEHHCDAVVVHCIDFRFHEAVASFLQDELKLKSYDIIAVAGGGKHLTPAGSQERQTGLLEDIDISLRLHEPKQIIVINHADCGAYGGKAAFLSVEAERETHRAALVEAAQTLKNAFPDKEVTTLLADVVNDEIVIH